MRAPAIRLVPAAVAALVILGCGGGGSDVNPPPPPPPAPSTLAKDAGDNQTGNVSQAVPVPPAVKVTTAAGAPVAGVAVTFTVASGGGSVTGATPTTGANGVATVGSWTLGPAAGANTLTASIPNTGVSGNPATFTATGALTALNPNASLNLSGNLSFTTITIPAGITVTMTGDLTLNATGAVTIAGNIVGDCKALTINATGALTVSGNLNNGCAGAIPAGGAPAMTLVGLGGYTLNGPGGFVAGGDVTITNDPTLTDASFAPGAFVPDPRLRYDDGPRSVGEPCVNNGYTGTAVPDNAPAGQDLSPSGTDGKDGSTWTLRCKGGSDIIIGGVLSLTGQHGGRGGHGTHSSGTAAVANGGKGGKGGAVKIQAIGSVSIAAGTITTGKGGAGGNATADGSTGHGGTIGASGTATGGAGGTPGLVTITAKTGTISLGPLTFAIGNAGKGGDATAIGGDGHDAEPCPPAIGGPATATAGLGGSTPDKQLSAAGGVIGLGNITVSGGAAGVGGNAVATAGKGGGGAKACKPGATGGAPTAKGGKGGDADLKNQNGVKIANGANGGSMEVKLGKGGQGWIDCILPIFEPGGDGGTGGSIAGFNGAFGTGLANGSAGAATYTTVANGGNGGDGVGPGAGGPAGGNGVTLNGGVTPTVVAPSFVPGNPGATCAAITSLLVSPPTQTIAQGGSGSIQATIARSESFTGNVTVQIKDQGGTVRGSGIIPSGQTVGTINFTVPVGEPAGSRTWTATASGTGVPDVTQNVGLTVTPAGGSGNVTIRNFNQATEPWTKVITKLGSGTWTSQSIGMDGSVTFAVPNTQEQFQLATQQTVGNNRFTSVYHLRADIMDDWAVSFGEQPTGNATTTVKGLPNNSTGVTFAGHIVSQWPQPNTSPFPVQLTGVHTGFEIIGGCARFSGAEPQSAIIGLLNYLNLGSYECDFGGAGVKNYTTVNTTATGVAGGTSLLLSGGFIQGAGIQTTVYAKSFLAPTTTYKALLGADLPSGVIQFETIFRTATNNFESVSYFFNNPNDWTIGLPPQLNTPVTSIQSSSPYYIFDISLQPQVGLSGAWSFSYNQANTFGGTNTVTHVAFPEFFGTPLPGMITVRTPTDLETLTMPRPGAGFVSGSALGLSTGYFEVPTSGQVWNVAVRLNVSF